MFDILVYLYETYYRPDACPEPAALARKLSAVGFDDIEISEALDWLNGLTEMAGTTNPALESSGTRFYIVFPGSRYTRHRRRRLHPVPRTGRPVDRVCSARSSSNARWRWTRRPSRWAS
jgi:hypothetical protein